MRSGKVRRKSIRRKVRGKTLGRKKLGRKRSGRKTSRRKTLGRKTSRRKTSGRKTLGRKNKKRMRGGDNVLLADIVRVTVVSRTGSHEPFDIRPKRTTMTSFITSLSQLAKVELGQVYLDDEYKDSVASLIAGPMADKNYNQWIDSLTAEQREKFSTTTIQKEEDAHPHSNRDLSNRGSASTLTFYTRE